MIHSQSHSELHLSSVAGRLVPAGIAIVIVLSVAGYAIGGRGGLQIAAICGGVCVLAGWLSSIPTVALARLAADGLVKGFMLSTLLRMTVVLAAVVVMIRLAGLSAPAVVGFASAAYLAVLAAEAWALLPGEQEASQ